LKWYEIDSRSVKVLQLTQIPQISCIVNSTGLACQRVNPVLISRRNAQSIEWMANIYGVLPVLEALRAGARRVDRIVIAEGARDARLRDLIEAARRGGVPVRREPRAALDRLTHNANHQGVVAIAPVATYSDADELLNRISPETILVLLDGIEDPHNLGAIIRTAECGGATAVIVPERRAAHISDIVAKTSAGAVEHLPVA